MSDTAVDESNEQEGRVSTQSKSEHNRAVDVVESTKEIIATAQNQVNECMLLLKDDLEKFEKSKEELKNLALNESEKLLLDLGYEADMLQDKEEAKIDFDEIEAKAQEGRVEVKEVASGKLSSFMIALFFALLMVAGILYGAAKATGTVLDFNQLPTFDTITPLFVWLGDKAIGTATLEMGIAVLAVTTLIFSYLIYIIRVSLRASKNLREAQKTHEEAEFYCSQKDECKAQMEKVDAHLNDTVNVIDFYRVLLQEQNMRLKRILFIEEKQEFKLYHFKSQLDLENTQRLVNTVSKLLATPIAMNGQLSPHAQEALMDAKAVVDKHVKAIYDNNIDDIF